MFNCSFNTTFKGKPKFVDGKAFYGDTRVYLGYGWVNFEGTIEDIFEALATEGFAISCELNAEANGNRKEKFFKSHQIALVDIDNGLTIEQLKAHPIYKKYACGFYTTPSHTEVNHRFRIIFQLQNAITNANDMRLLYTGLIRIFGGDKACKDASRIFFGTINAKQKQLDASKFLSEKATNRIIENMRQEQLQTFQSASQEQVEITDEFKAKVKDLLSQCYSGEYNMWFSIACAMKHSGYSLQDFIDVTVGKLMNQKSAKRCETVWNAISEQHHKKATMGSLIWFIKDKLGSHCFDQN